MEDNLRDCLIVFKG